MMLSTSTNLLCERPDGSLLPLEDMLKICTGAGFRYFDMSFYEWSYPGQPFIGEDWEHWIHHINAVKESLGVHFYQSHAYTYDFLNPANDTPSVRESQEMLVERSIRCCGILGNKVIVLHPSMNPTDDLTSEENWKRNLPYLERWMAMADRLGMEVAIENMYQYSGQTEKRFFSEADEIKSLLESYGDLRMGCCWDFEHGVIQRMEQSSVVHTLGKHLKATHVSDTVSNDFEPYMHVLPFTGMLDWKPIMQALMEEDYRGAFSFEAHNFAKKLPDPLIGEAMRYAHAVGDYLTNLYTVS